MELSRNLSMDPYFCETGMSTVPRLHFTSSAYTQCRLARRKKTCLKAVSVFLASLFWHGHFHVALKLHKLTEIASLVITIQLHLITSFCLPKASTLNPIPLVWPPPSSWSSEFIVKFLVVLCTRWLIPVLRKYSNLGLHHLGSKHISPFQDDWWTHQTWAKWWVLQTPHNKRNIPQEQINSLTPLWTPRDFQDSRTSHCLGCKVGRGHMSRETVNTLHADAGSADTAAFCCRKRMGTKSLSQNQVEMDGHVSIAVRLNSQVFWDYFYRCLLETGGLQQKCVIQ